MDKRHEYKGRRKQKKPIRVQKNHYGKKFLKQLAVSALILAGILSPRLFDSEASIKVNSVAKSAFNYNLDTSRITNVLNKILKKALSESAQGEYKNEATQNPKENP